MPEDPTVSEPPVPVDTEAQTSDAGPAAIPKPEDKPCKASVSGSGPGSVSDPAAEPAPEPSLPALTPQEFRIYNRLAEQMDYFVHTPPFPVILLLSN